MRYQKPLRWLISLIGVLALFAAGAGLFWPGEGPTTMFMSHRGEVVMLYGRGLYRYDTVSMATQARATDLVTLVIGLPLLSIATWLSVRGSLRGRLLLSGTLGYFLYTAMSLAFLAAYNELFLVYVALFSLSLVAFVLSMMAFDLAELPGAFSSRLPRRSIAALLFVAAGFLLLAWLGRILPPLLRGATPALENTTTLVIQAMDLGLVVPLCVLGGMLLLRKHAWGYLLASVALLKMVTLGLAVSAMAITMLWAGLTMSVVELLVFPALTLASLALAAVLLQHVAPRLPEADSA
jgi:hypothetical protein